MRFPVIAIDPNGVGSFALTSAVIATWQPGRYKWVLFAFDGINRTVAQGVMCVDPDPAGVLMQAKVRNEHGKETAETKRIEQEWKRWCKAGRCTADGCISLLGVQHMVIKNCPREGENLTKSVLGDEFNDTGFALQMLDSDQLDDTMMQAIDNARSACASRSTRTAWPIAYHLFDGHPYDQIQGTRTRIPASEIVHTAVWERPAQTRGYTWMSAAIVLKLKNGLITYADALASLGLDFKETMTERAMEQAFLEALGIVVGTDLRGQADTATDDSMSDADATDDNGKAAKPAAAKPAAKTKPAAPKPTRMLEIEDARELFRRLRAEA